MGPDLFVAQALPKSGNLTIGRADNADIRITDPLASRLHARLHVGEGGLFEIEDIGSINRTKVRDVALEHGARVAVLPGEAVTIGSTILMVQETRATARNRRVWPHTHFEARIEEECSGGARTPFAIIRLAVEGNQPAGTVADTISPALRTSDMLALFGPSDYEIFLPATPPELGSAINNDLIGRLRAQSIVARTGMACHPRDGQTPEALVARSSERLRGKETPAPVDGVVVEDPRMRRVYGLATSAARGTISVLILGETGVGKDVMAQEIHRMSPRAKAPFVAINCAAVSEGLLESELFGHEKGAFTGATEAKAGLLETAPGGTVFLDEIGDMPPQAAGDAPARHPDPPAAARRQPEDAPDRRALHRRHPPQPGGGDRRGAVPPGPLLPPERHLAAHPAPARAPERDPAAGAVVRRAVRARGG